MPDLRVPAPPALPYTSFQFESLGFANEAPQWYQCGVDGYGVVKAVESVGSSSGATAAKVLVSDCGQA